MYKDNISAAQLICETKLELPLETEFLIPDYLPQVFKVVKCMVIPVVLQKQISPGRLNVEGYLRCIVFYQAEGSGDLCQTEQKVPFSKQADCRQGEYDYACAPVEIGGEVEYVNCRALSGRRMEVRGAFALSVRACAYRRSDVITALDGEYVYPKSETLQTAQMAGMAEKILTAEGDIAFEGEPEVILHTQCSSTMEEVKLLSGKAVVKGTVQAQVIYRAKGSEELLKTTADIPFHEILDMEHADEQCRAVAMLNACGCTITGTEDDKTQLAVTAALTVRAWKDIELCVVQDAFSSQQEMELETAQTPLEQVYEPLDEHVSASVSGQLADAESEVLMALATPLSVELLENQEQCVLRGRVMAHVFCRNSAGEIDCYDKVCEYTVERELTCRAAEICLLCQTDAVSVRAEKNGAELAAQLELNVTGFLSMVRATTTLAQVQLTEEPIHKENAPALYLYFAQENEAIYEIAKRYHVCPEALCEINHCAQGVLEEPKRLLVPRGM